MRVTELNLWVGNVNEFRFLICADDEEQAVKIGEGYKVDAGLDGALEVTEFSDVNTSFSCDYIVR